ncbi:hypothetical protein D3C71_2089670 [compost metagenome]
MPSRLPGLLILLRQPAEFLLEHIAEMTGIVIADQLGDFIDHQIALEQQPAGMIQPYLR